MSIRFPQGRASERVVNDILQIADGIKRNGPIEVGPPITSAAIVDRLNLPNMPTNIQTAVQGQAIDAAASEPAQPSIPGTEEQVSVARGENMLDQL